MYLGVCFLHHKSSARVGPCWGLSQVCCGVTAPSRLSLAGIFEVCPHQWCSWWHCWMWLLKPKVVIPGSPASWSFCSAAMKCFVERPFKVLMALGPLAVWSPWWQVGLRNTCCLLARAFWASCTCRAWRDSSPALFSPWRMGQCLFPLHHTWLSFSVG